MQRDRNDEQAIPEDEVFTCIWVGLIELAERVNETVLGGDSPHAFEVVEHLRALYKEQGVVPMETD